MLAAGKWIAAKEFNGHASFKLNQLYSPFVAWGKMVTNFLDAQGNIAKLEAVTNTIFGEPWKPVENVNYESLAMQTEVYPAEVPPGVILLTAGVDIQKYRIEVEVVGWGLHGESWSIDYKVLEGDTGVEAENDDDDGELTNVWDDLADYLTSTFIGLDNKAFRVQCAAIDSGYLATVVYRFCHKHRDKRWFPIKGFSDPFRPIISKATKVGRNKKEICRMFPVGVTAAKDAVFAALRVVKKGAKNYCHFPDKPHYDDAHWKQLSSERMKTHTRGGRTFHSYEKVGPNVRNEALDVRCYSLAAKEILNPDLERMAKRHLQHTEAADRAAEDVRPETGDERPDPTPPTTPEGRRRGFRVINNAFSGYKP